MKKCKVCGKTQYQNALYGDGTPGNWSCWECIDHSKRRSVPAAKKPMQIVDGMPRRCRIDLYTPAETAIRAAMLAVEDAGCHELLTDAVELLAQAKDKVSDFVELRDGNDITCCDWQTAPRGEQEPAAGLVTGGGE